MMAIRPRSTATPADTLRLALTRLVADSGAAVGCAFRLCRAGDSVRWSELVAIGEAPLVRELLGLQDGPVPACIGADLDLPPSQVLLRFGPLAAPLTRDGSAFADLCEKQRLRAGLRWLLLDDHSLPGGVLLLWPASRCPGGAPSEMSGDAVTAVRAALPPVLEAPGPFREGPGYCVLTGAGAPLWRTPQAEAWLTPKRLAQLVALLPGTPLSHGVAARTAVVEGVEVVPLPVRAADGNGTEAWLVALAAAKAPALEPLRRLTPAQQQVVELALVGATAEEIARHLRRSVETVRTHLKAAYLRLGVANRVELARVVGRGGGADS